MKSPGVAVATIVVADLVAIAVYLYAQGFVHPSGRDSSMLLNGSLAAAVALVTVFLPMEILRRRRR